MTSAVYTALDIPDGCRYGIKEAYLLKATDILRDGTVRYNGYLKLGEDHPWSNRSYQEVNEILFKKYDFI